MITPTPTLISMMFGTIFLIASILIAYIKHRILIVPNANRRWLLPYDVMMIFGFLFSIACCASSIFFAICGSDLPEWVK